MDFTKKKTQITQSVGLSTLSTLLGKSNHLKTPLH